MNKTLANFLGIPQKPAATVVVVNGALGAGADAAPADADADAAPADAAPTGAAPTDAAPTDAAPTDAAPADADAAPAADASAATAQGAAMVSISQAELTTLQAAATELAEMKPKYEILNTWYSNVKGEGVTLGQDPTGATEKKSWEKAPWNQ